MGWPVGDLVSLVALEGEWESLVRGSLRLAFRRWRASELALRRFEDPRRLLAFLWNKKASPLEKDRVFLALLRLAHGGEALAGRVVLQAMLPALKAMAKEFLRRHPDLDSEPVFDREELWQVLFASMLEEINGYRLESRPRKVAANLRWDTYHAVVAEFYRARPAWEEELPVAEALEPLVEEEWVTPTLEDVEAPLRRAVAAGAISEAEADLILQTHIEGVPLQVAAERLGISYNAAKHRRRRAVRRLLMFLRPWTQDLYVPMDPKRPLDRPSSGAYAPEEPDESAESAEQTG
jgi:DNA-directed RNA polymerase specialized sigma24 family protein